jgi:hypothetical protein
MRPNIPTNCITKYRPLIANPTWLLPNTATFLMGRDGIKVKA